MGAVFSTSQAESFFIGQLDSLSGRKHRNKNFYNICCPFHADRTPSCGVRTRSGKWNCLGCHKTGEWNELASALNLTQIKEGQKFVEDQVQFDAKKYDDLIDASVQTLEGLLKADGIMSFTPWDKQREWRTFKGDFLNEIGALNAVWKTSTGNILPIIYFPIKVDDEYVGGIRALLQKPKRKGMSSYFNSAGEGWASDKGLFPYVYVKRMMRKRKLHYVVLVEGPRDALRLIRAGVPALCVLGTNQFTEKKARLLNLLGPDLVIVLGDGDVSGRSLNRLAKKIMREYVKTVAVNLPIRPKPNALDPGNMPVSMIRDLKEFAKEKLAED